MALQAAHRPAIVLFLHQGSCLSVSDLQVSRYFRPPGEGKSGVFPEWLWRGWRFKGMGKIPVRQGSPCWELGSRTWWSLPPRMLVVFMHGLFLFKAEIKSSETPYLCLLFSLGCNAHPQVHPPAWGWSFQTLRWHHLGICGVIRITVDKAGITEKNYWSFEFLTIFF